MQLVSPCQASTTDQMHAMDKNILSPLGSWAYTAYDWMHDLPRQVPCYNDGQEC